MQIEFKTVGGFEMKRNKIVAMTMALSIGMMGSVVSVSAASKLTPVKNTEFGTFSYGIIDGNNQVEAKTHVTKKANKLHTKVEVQINATGKKIGSADVTLKNGLKNDIKVSKKNIKKNLAAFSCHEAIGKGNVTKYDAEIF